MLLQRLDVNGLRNLRSVRLDDCRRVNILLGSNGSGKTSLLEAIYLLGMGRSFRSNYSTSLINYEADNCAIYGELNESQGGSLSIGVMRTRRGRQDLRVNKRSAENAAELAAILPLQLINAEAFTLIDGGPRVRRQFMDWGAFHVKPTFLGHWRNAQRCLRQRNHLLKLYQTEQRARIYPAELAAWDKELASYAADIDNLRSQYIKELCPLFDQILQQLVDLPKVSLDYQRGWKEDQDLQVALEIELERDIRYGTTTTGPHRANIDVRVGGRPAVNALSRGQLKLVVSSLRLAQGAHLVKYKDSRCAYLIDDLPAELDKANRLTLCRLLDEIGCQIFITSTDNDLIENSWLDQGAVRKFHVKQGQVFDA